ncbi:MAG: LacI family DNA-binding transcriptional regulator [Lachnospiraceae bacterium]|nr:LacI family DNA-binding transcriptional regulator [Lachnospiraceae bacterium]
MGRVTIKDIAQLAGVSYASVSRALNGGGKISEETRKRILQICEQEGYRVNIHARNLSSHKTFILGVIVPNIANPFYSDIVLHFSTHAQTYGYHILLCNSLFDPALEEEMLGYLIDQQVDGIVLVSPRNYSIDYVRRFQKSIPIILLGGSFYENDLRGINIVNLDNRSGGHLAADYLYRLGHRDIVYLGYRSGTITHKERLGGFMDELAQYNIQPYVIENKDDHSSIEKGYELGKELFQSSRHFTAVSCSADMIALGVIKAASECGIRIPEDISLLGFDNNTYSSLPGIELSTIDQRKELMAKASVDLLISLIESPVSGEYVRKTFMPELIVRKSCRSIL